MKNKILAFSILFSLLLSIAPVLASVSSVTTSSSASTATTGTSVTITASITDTTSESQSASLITSPSGITVSDPSGGQYQSVSLSTTPVTKTFTMSAAAPNTYSYYVTSGGTPSTTDTIVFVSPSTLTVSGSPASTTKASGGTFTFSVTISNPSSSAVTTSYALTCPSGFTCSGDPTSSSGTVISAGSSTPLAWTVTVGGTSASATVSLQIGDTTNAFSTSVSCSDCASSSSSTTTTTTTTTNIASTSGVKVTTVKGKATITIPSIAAGKSATVVIDKTEDVAITLITVTVKNTNNNIQIIVTKLSDKPASITQDVSGKVYNYVQIDKTNITDSAINQTAIRFKVPKSWITANNVNDSTILLNRHVDNAWTKLSTARMSEDSTDVIYEAISPGFSVFAISGEAKGTSTEPATTGENNNKTVNGTKETAGKLSGKTNTTLVVVIVIIAIISGGAFFLYKKGIFDPSKSIPRKTRWEDLKKKYAKR